MSEVDLYGDLEDLHDNINDGEAAPHTEDSQDYLYTEIFDKTNATEEVSTRGEGPPASEVDNQDDLYTDIFCPPPPVRDATRGNVDLTKDIGQLKSELERAQSQNLQLQVECTAKHYFLVNSGKYCRHK